MPVERDERGKEEGGEREERMRRGRGLNEEKKEREGRKERGMGKVG